MPKERGQQINLYLSAEMAADMDAAALALAKRTGRAHNRQDVAKLAFKAWWLAEQAAKLASAKGSK